MKRTLCLLLAILLLLSLCACRDSGGSQPQLFFVGSDENAYFAAISAAFCDAAQKLGYASTVVYPQSDSAEAQIALIEDLIEQGAKGIALNASQKDGLEAVLKKAKDAGIPVVTVCQDTKGSQLYIQPSSLELVGISLMDAIYDFAEGEGTFAVLSGETPFSGVDPWVNGMKLAARDSKYQKLTWAETNYSFNGDGNVEEMMALLVQLRQKYPDLDAICCPGPQTLLACCQAIAELGMDIKVTGLCMEPANMQEFVGDDKMCPYFFTWDTSLVGSCVAHALEALVDGAAMLEGQTLVTKQGEFTLEGGYDGHMQITAGPPAICDD